MSNEHITSTLCLKNTTTRGRVCDTCRLNPGLIFCEADLAYLCTTCDSHVHAANKLSSNHKRVRVCDVCRQAPRAYICNAEATTLCIACDTVIHSTNSLSHRLPLMPMHQDTEPWSVIGLPKRERTKDNEDEDEAASWLIYDSPAKINVQNQNGVASEFLCNGDEYLELGDYNSFQNTDQFCTDLKFNEDYNYINDDTNTILHHHHHHHHLDQHQQQMHGGCDVDILVPVQSGDVKKYHQPQQRNFQNPKSEYETSINGGYGYFASLSDSVSLSSMEVGSVDLFSSCSSIQTQTQLTAVLEREAKVLRYREKKKTRKFEKTIRYASRKACADTKPRIHGRFAKRTNSDTDIQRDQMFSESLIKEDGYCSVPSF